jgi:6-phosphogluconate dehydrogenase
MDVATAEESAVQTGTGERHIGLVGLAVMGENLALNIANHGFPLAVYNRTAARTEAFMGERAGGTGIHGAFDVPAFVAALARPRRIILMVKAGEPVDATIASLTPYLERGDTIIDGGNSFFHDSERRAKELQEQGFNFVGMGVSGGEEGAIRGPSLMPGGPDESYAQLEPMLVAISAKTEAGPCVTHIGPGGSGHYVKMVHNGIEYGDMQLIAETYDVMRRALGMTAPEMSKVFARWNEGKLASYLIEVSAAVLDFVDVETGQPLVDVILDQAEQKGTGRWTSQNALELGTPTPTIDAAVAARIMSSKREQRTAASKILRGPEGNNGNPPSADIEREALLTALEDALYFAKVSSYAQGMALLRTASQTYNYGLDLAEIARIWKGGCIIRAALLDPIRAAFGAEPDLENLLLAPAIAETVNASMAGARTVIRVARALGIPCPALSAALDYVDTYRQERLPANLIQGQRDFFGAHTYKRLDKEGTFHTEWTPVGPPEVVEAVPSDREMWAGGRGEGDRSPRKGDLPSGAAPSVTEPAEEGTLGDADTRGERSPDAQRKADY